MLGKKKKKSRKRRLISRLSLSKTKFILTQVKQYNKIWFYPGLDFFHIKNSVNIVQAIYVTLEASLNTIYKRYKGA